ncbi:hypothetical protein CBS115989_10631 [Aspergillus niger]|nr:hypothetical protein CBS115989_10631 [Aspergillus niger]KAI2835118.1 hypothetical protein CBS11232_10609 [Aspergillus niger]KAI2868520.1 hypothetical protein CBS115988_10648 [Aspergillus niger]KAI2906446.1 hypothetical protein CBS11852_870 [Aspergillus niger]
MDESGCAQAISEPHWKTHQHCEKTPSRNLLILDSRRPLQPTTADTSVPHSKCPPPSRPARRLARPSPTLSLASTPSTCTREYVEHSQKHALEFITISTLPASDFRGTSKTWRQLDGEQKDKREPESSFLRPPLPLPNSENKSEEGEVQDELTAPMHGVSFKKRAPRAIKEIRAFATRAMGTTDVRVDPQLNKKVWEAGVKGVPYRLRVRISRKRNDEEGAKEKLYSYVQAVNVKDVKGLHTAVVDEE